MADKSGKTWMAVGETDDPNAVINVLPLMAPSPRALQST